MDNITIKKSYTLNNGTEIPSVGLGSASFKDKDAMVRGIMEAGYRHIDTATLYNNEEIVGEALEECFKQGLKREEIYVTTKIWHPDYAEVEGTLKKSLKMLKLDYVDLYLIHWPLGYYATPQKPVHILWPEMEALVGAGLTKSIGVSNFNV